MQSMIMKWRLSALVVCGGMLLLAVAGCKKDQYPAIPAQATLQSTIAQDTSLSLFQLALHRTQLDTVLRSGGPYTIFAPVNSAFLAAGLNANVIGSYDLQQLSDIISYQIIPGQIGSVTIVGFTTDSAISLNPQYTPLISLNYYGVFIDGIPTVQGNIALADGILQKTAGVAFPPTGSFLQVLDSLPNTTMAAYIFNHSAALLALATSPVSMISGSLGFVTGNYVTSSATMLIPTDAAFAAYGYNTPADLAALDTLTRTNLVAHGLLGGTYFTSDFLGGAIAGGASPGYSQASGKPTLVLLAGDITLFPYTPQYDISQLVDYNSNYEIGDDGLTLNGNGILTPPQIIQANIVTTGGPLHLINQVFAPYGEYAPGHRHY